MSLARAVLMRANLRPKQLIKSRRRKTALADFIVTHPPQEMRCPVTQHHEELVPGAAGGRLGFRPSSPTAADMPGGARPTVRPIPKEVRR